MPQLKIEFDESETSNQDADPTPEPKSPAIEFDESKRTEAEMEDYTLVEALKEASKNFGESWTQNVRDTIEGVKPENWKYIYALGAEVALLTTEPFTKPNVGRFIGRNILHLPESWLGDDKDLNPNEYPMLVLMKDDIIATYGSWKKFKNALAKDPVRVSSDLMALVPVGALAGTALKGVKSTARIAKLAKIMKQATDKVPLKGTIRTGTKVALDPGGTAAEFALQKTVVDPLKMKAGLNPEGYNPEIPDSGRGVVEAGAEFVGDREDIPAGVLSSDPEVAWQEARQYAEGEQSKDPNRARLSQEVRDRFETSRQAMQGEGGTQDALARQAFELPTTESMRAEIQSKIPEQGTQPLEFSTDTEKVRAEIEGTPPADEIADLLVQFDRETATEGLTGLSDELIAKLELSEVGDSPQLQNLIVHREKLAGIDPSNLEVTGERIIDGYEDSQNRKALGFRQTFNYRSQEAYRDQPIDFDTDATTIFKKTTEDTQDAPIPDTLKAGTPTRMIKGNWGGKYQGRYDIAEMDDIIFSHYADGSENPLYPQRLQPRDRSDVSSQMQAQQMAQGFDADLALDDTSSMNDGTVIVKRAEDVYTPDEIAELEAQGHSVQGKWVVLSGNGRMAAKHLASQLPQAQESLQMYRSKLEANLQAFGQTEANLEGKNAPVLVRELTTELDDDGITQFVEEANDFSGKGSRSAEVAARDAKRIDNDLLNLFQFGEQSTLRDALKSASNRDFVNGFINKFSKDKQSLFYDKAGKQISDEGFGRIERAMLTSVYDSEIGAILSGKLADVSEPGLINIKKAIYASLPELASMKALIEAGERLPALDITDDLAKAVLKIDELGKEGTSAAHARAQGSLFEGTDLGVLDDDATRLYLMVERGKAAPGDLRDFIKWYAAQVESQPSVNQGTLLEGVEPVTKTDILQQALGEQFDEIPDITELQTEWREQGVKRAETQAEVATEQSVGRAYKLFPEMMEALEEMEAENKLKPGKDLVALRNHIDEMATNLAEGGDISLLNIDTARTTFRQDLKVSVRNGELTSLGSGSKADKVYQAMTNDFYTAIEKQMAKHPDVYPEDLLARVKTSKAQYQATMFLENQKGGAAEFLRANQKNPRDIINKIVNGNLKTSALNDLYKILGPVGTSELRAGIIAKVFKNTNQNWTALQKYLDPTLKGINKDNPRRLVELLGGDATAEAIASKMKELAEFKARFAIEQDVIKGSKTALLLNRMGNEMPELVGQTLELAALASLGESMINKRSIAIMAFSFMRDSITDKRLMKSFADSPTGRQWLLEGKKFKVGSLTFEWRDIASLIHDTASITAHQQRRTAAREQKRPAPPHMTPTNWRDGYRNRIQRDMQ